MTDFLRDLLGSYEFTSFVLVAFASGVMALLGYIGVLYRRHILRQLGPTEIALLRSIAVIAVRYAEQKFAEQGGPAKLAAAVEAADRMLEGYGITVKAEQLLAILEAAVYAETARMTIPDPAFPTVEAAAVYAETDVAGVP